MEKPEGKAGLGSLRKAMYIVAGTMSLGLGALGVFLPVLPTTPFLLLSAACYYKGSERMHRWLLNNKVFGGYIRNYKEGKGISLRGKVFASLLLWTTICLSAIYVGNFLVQTALFVIATIVTIHIMTLPTYRREQRQTSMRTEGFS